MTPAGLVFLAALLASIVCLIVAAAALAMANWRRAIRTLAGWSIGMGKPGTGTMFHGFSAT